MSKLTPEQLLDKIHAMATLIESKLRDKDPTYLSKHDVECLHDWADQVKEFSSIKRRR